MGCWNGTDGFTNLPIQAGDKVVCFIVLNGAYLPKEWCDFVRDFRKRQVDETFSLADKIKSIEEINHL